MKPAESRVCTGFLPRLPANSRPSWNASSEVVTARMTSTSGMTWAGLKKCRPRKRSGREVAAAWSIDRQRGRVGGEVGLGLDDAVELAPHLELEAEVLGDRLDHEVAVRVVGVVERRRDAAADGVGVGLLELALLDRARELLLDLAHALGEPVVVDLAQDDVVARLRGHLCDSVPHQAGAEDADLLDLSHGAAAYCSPLLRGAHLDRALADPRLEHRLRVGGRALLDGAVRERERAAVQRARRRSRRRARRRPASPRGARRCRRARRRCRRGARSGSRRRRRRPPSSRPRPARRRRAPASSPRGSPRTRSVSTPTPSA